MGLGRVKKKKKQKQNLKQGGKKEPHETTSYVTIP